MSCRVVITGAGWITPMGHDIESVWKRLVAGDTAVAAIDRFDATTFPTNFANQVRGYDWTNYVEDASRHGQPGMHTAFALGAARQAWDLAGLGDMQGLDRRRCGLYLGSGEGVLDFDSYQKTSLSAWNGESIDDSEWLEAAKKHIACAY